ncbi:uncharacterized protein LOC105233793 isoform X1 [Bactrocera dorsalis]|uniref:Uncharacterized protein LOC105233793 n=2 Tax=Bactrocera dorsalis TaxID=27457 RepID=A0A034WAN6_BACDO|nr:uncharacterized protein LOC105233793 isoform X1 [Bactrocera dorsalis]
MKFLASVLVIFMSLALVMGQRFFPIPTNFNFNSGGLSSPNAIRDGRNNRGPVLFPPSPPNQFDESSGVIVGASGYGFVPPQQQNSGETYYTTAYRVPADSYTAFNYFSDPYSHQFTLL